MNPHALIRQFSQKRIAVIGDIMLDRYIFGAVERISPEAPIPIVQRQETMLVPGGAGNTAATISGLGGQCTLIGVAGQDTAGDELLETLATFGITTHHIARETRPTTEKIRVLGNHQQIVRIDHEVTKPLETVTTEKLCHILQKTIHEYQAIIVCDYAKGVMSEQLMNCIRAGAKDQMIPVLADVRPEHKSLYHHLSFITPNKKETSGMVGHSVRTRHDAEEHGLRLAQELKTNILLTMSEEGMLVIEHQTQKVHHLPTKAMEIVDVSGAGDTVIATMALGLASGADPHTAALIANHAASVVVAKLGTASVSQDELLATFKE